MPATHPPYAASGIPLAPPTVAVPAAEAPDPGRAAGRVEGMRLTDWPSTVGSEYGAISLPKHLVPLAWFLLSREYSDAAIERIVEHAAREGSVQCSKWLDEADRAGAEHCLPYSMDWHGAVHDFFRWELGPER